MEVTDREARTNAAAVLALPLMGVGCASKYAVEGMTDYLRVELQKLSVRVSLVEPGMTYADADKPVFREAMNADFDYALSRIPDDQIESLQSSAGAVTGSALAGIAGDGFSAEPDPWTRNPAGPIRPHWGLVGVWPGAKLKLEADLVEFLLEYC